MTWAFFSAFICQVIECALPECCARKNLLPRLAFALCYSETFSCVWLLKKKTVLLSADCHLDTRHRKQWKAAFGNANPFMQGSMWNQRQHFQLKIQTHKSNSEESSTFSRKTSDEDKDTLFKDSPETHVWRFVLHSAYKRSDTWHISLKDSWRYVDDTQKFDANSSGNKPTTLLSLMTTCFAPTSTCVGLPPLWRLFFSYTSV